MCTGTKEYSTVNLYINKHNTIIVIYRPGSILVISHHLSKNYLILLSKATHTNCGIVSMKSNSRHLKMDMLRLNMCAVIWYTVLINTMHLSF